MKFEIHFTDRLGVDDFCVVEGDDFNKLQRLATEGVTSRGGIDPWSKYLSECESND